MTKARFWMLLLAAAVLALGCGDDGDTNTGDTQTTDTAGTDTAGTDTAGTDTAGTDTAGTDTAGTDTTGTDDQPPPAADRFVTYNVGLAHGYVDYADERLTEVQAALSALEADVVCIQEAWLDDDVNAILAGTNAAFPHSYWEATTAEAGVPSCTADEVAPLEACVAANCAGVEPSELSTCALENCQTEFFAVSADCQSCIAANLGGTMEEIISACVLGTGSSMSYDGRNGLILLSKVPMTGTEHLVMSSFLVQRAVLHARVELEALGTVDVYCTHLAADLDEPVYNGEFDSYAAEQAHQATETIGWIDTTSAGGVTVLMGDMNTGPALGTDVTSELPENYQLFIDAGFVSPFTDLDPPICSFCNDNTLIVATNDKAIDHVFLKDVPAQATFQAERIMDQTTEIQSGGDPVTTHVSDHYGVRVTIEL